MQFRDGAEVRRSVSTIGVNGRTRWTLGRRRAR